MPRPIGRSSDWSRDRWKEWVAIYESGANMRTIAARYGVAVSAVAYAFRQLGYKARPAIRRHGAKTREPGLKPSSDAMTERNLQIRYFVAIGYTLTEVGALFGIGRQRVAQICGRDGSGREKHAARPRGNERTEE